MSSTWNDEFYKEGGMASDPIFRVPHADLPSFIQAIRQNQGQRILDLGCGSGRHVIALAKEGFEVFGIDTSERAIQMTQQWLDDENLQADLRTGDIFTTLPYPDDHFDGVISIKAMHHGLLAQIQQLIEELKRVLKSGGVLMIEVPEAKQLDPKKHQVLEPGTTAPLEGPEKGVPHHRFANQEDLLSILSGFETVDIHQTGGKGSVTTPSPHYLFIGRLE